MKSLFGLRRVRLLLHFSKMHAPILCFPDFSKPFHLHVDASLGGLGTTLGQIQDNREVVIAHQAEI